MDESEKIYRLESACLTNALRVAFVQGEGTQENPCRLMWRFYLPDGRYIGEIPADGQDDRVACEGGEMDVHHYKENPRNGIGHHFGGSVQGN